MPDPNQIPDGYMQDGQGRLVPLEMVKEIHKLEDTLVQDLIKRAKAASEELARFKESSLGDFISFVELLAEEYDAKGKGQSGTATYFSYDKKYRVELASSDRPIFDGRLQVAKELIDACIKDWGKGAAPEIITLVNDAFDVDKRGTVNASRVLSLRKFKIKDQRWKNAMEAINDSLTMVKGRKYLRFYEQVEDTDEMRQIPLAFPRV